MRIALIVCAIYACAVLTVQAVLLLSLLGKTDMIKQNMAQQIYEVQQQLSNQIACQLDQTACK